MSITVRQLRLGFCAVSPATLFVDTTFLSGYPYRTDFDPGQGVIVSELSPQTFLGFFMTLFSEILQSHFATL